MNRFIIADASKCHRLSHLRSGLRGMPHQEHQDCASLTPHTFQPRIHVIKRGQCFHGDRLPSV